MKNTTFSLMLLAMTLLALASCKRDNPVTNEPDPTDIQVAAKDIVAPSDFNFETEKDLQIRVGVANATPGERYVIKIYNNVPSSGALISTGLTDANGEYNTNIRVAAWEDYIFIEKINPDGSSSYEKVKANLFVSALFDNGTPDRYIVRKSGSGMDCNTGCTSTQNNHTNNTIVNNGETVCFTGTISGGITIRDGGIAKICASGSVGVTIEGNGKLYVLENTILNFNYLNMNSSNTTFKSWSDSLKTSGSVSLNGYNENNGKWYVNGDLNINSNGELKNYGTINVNSNLNNNKKLYNYHHIIVNGSFQNNSNAEFYNYCFFWAKQNFINNKDAWNSSFIKVGATYTENSNGKMDLENGAAIFTNNLMLNGEIKGSNTNRSKVKVSSNTTINSSGKLQGKVDLCDSNGVETNNGTLQNSAALDCGGYIASSTCMPEAFGQPTIQDADNDGVADGQDEYPNDATRAFNSYYPSATTTATLAFEDLWPATGDYDFNDLVLAFNIQKVLNADNEVVDYKVKMKVRAIGASFDNGFGFRLDDVLPAAVNSVNGQVLTKNLVSLSSNGTESGQDRAVIICYESPETKIQRPGGSMFNTIKTNGTGTSDTIYVNVNFGTPVADSKLTIDKFNPFMFTNQRRGYEIHLGNFKPTSLATTSLFGTAQDRSNPSNNIYYKTANGMPWAIMLPSDFAYPTERTPVTDAFNYFDDWAISGGSNNTNWYTDAPGNRNSSSIY